MAKPIRVKTWTLPQAKLHTKGYLFPYRDKVIKAYPYTSKLFTHGLPIKLLVKILHLCEQCKGCSDNSHSINTSYMLNNDRMIYCLKVVGQL